MYDNLDCACHGHWFPNELNPLFFSFIFEIGSNHLPTHRCSAERKFFQ